MPEPQVPAGRAARWRWSVVWIGRVGLLLYLALLLTTGNPGLRGAVSDVSIWDLQNTQTLVRWLRDLATLWLVEFILAIPIGALAMLAAGACGSQRRGRGRVWIGLLAGVALTGLLLAVEESRLPEGMHGLLAVGGCLLGAWMAIAALDGPRSLVRRVSVIGTVALGATMAGAGLAYLAVETAPLPFSTPLVTSEQKRHVYGALSAPQAAGDEVRHLRLTAQDINFLVAWFLSLGSSDRKGTVVLGPGRAEAQASARVPGPWLGEAYVNVEVAGALGVDDGRPWLRLERLRVGRFSVPGMILATASPIVLWAIRSDPDTRQLVQSIVRLRVEQDAVEVVLQPRAVHPRIMASLLARLGAKPDVLAATRDHLQHLVDVAPTLPVGGDGFAAFVRAAFARAQQRSQASDPALENRAAVFALAVLLGHRRVEDFVGPITTPEIRRLASQRVGGVTLRGRRDWAQHFWVSAGLALLSAEAISNAAGLLKEELDAGGGSGFSFGDLLADRAGTRFALSATRDAAAARAMQIRLRDRWPLDDLFPLADDLPEGIQDAELTSKYGGVGGGPYQRLIEEIERRLDRCAALR